MSSIPVAEKDRRISDAIRLARPLLILIMCLAHLPYIESFMSDHDSYKNLSTLIPVYFKDFLSRGAVPTLSVISGYLAFFTYLKITSYRSFASNKAKRLLLPFIIWNLLAFAIFTFIIKLPMPDMRGMSVPPSTWDYLNGYFGIRRVPFNAPTYFLRDLFLLMLALPLIHRICQRWWVLALVSIMIIAIFHDLPAIVFPVNRDGLLVALFYRWDTPIFFAMGYAVALRGYQLPNLSKTSCRTITGLLLLVGVGISMAISYYTPTSDFLKWRAAMGLLFILALPWLLTSLLNIKHSAFGRFLNWLSPYSFMIFLSHGPFSMIFAFIIIKVLGHPITERSPIWQQTIYTLAYLAFSIMIAVVLLTLWRKRPALLRKL